MAGLSLSRKNAPRMFGHDFSRKMPRSYDGVSYYNRPNGLPHTIFGSDPLAIHSYYGIAPPMDPYDLLLEHRSLLMELNDNVRDLRQALQPGSRPHRRYCDHQHNPRHCYICALEHHLEGTDEGYKLLGGDHVMSHFPLFPGVYERMRRERWLRGYPGHPR